MKNIRVIVLGVGLAVGLGWVGWSSIRPAPPAKAAPASNLRLLTRNTNNPADRQHLRNPFPRMAPNRPVAATPPGNATTPAAPTPQTTTAPLLIKLDSANATVQTQLSLLVHGSDQELHRTFLPEVADKLTPEVIQTCRQRIRQMPVRPDWQMAHSTVDAQGRPTRMVSMFGKSETGFHLIDGNWLADAVWCNPPGFP